MNDPRLDGVLEVLLAFARNDFSQRIPVHGTDTVDAIATGLNLLAEELESKMASRRELEAAYEELRRTEAQLVQASRMAAVGLLASGVAHEVNNPAGAVTLALGMMTRSIGRVRRLVADVDSGDAVDVELTQIEVLLADSAEGMRRVNEVVGDLLVFARANDPSFEPISFDEVIASSWRLASASIGAIPLTLELEETPTFVANRGRIAQVMMNLLLNAAHAARGSKETARIYVATRAQAGGVLLSVEDDGHGIPEEHRTRVFDPFFTTKTAREGTGLGLTIVAQIAGAYGGWARVADPERGRGARIEVWFPCEPRRVSQSA